MNVRIDRFSAGLDELTRKQQADPKAVLRVLEITKRFSCFEASENDVIARTITRMIHKGLILKKSDGTKTEYGQLIKTTGGDYPWTTVEITEGGKRLLNE